MRKYQTILIQYTNVGKVLVIDFSNGKQQELTDTNIPNEINRLNKEGYFLSAIGNVGEHYMTKEI